jgi:two-component system, cell cycle response regulator
LTRQSPAPTIGGPLKAVQSGGHNNMTAPTSERYTVALQGFSAFERETLASFFRLAADRTPAYEQADDLIRSDFVVADADSAASLQDVIESGRTRDTVFVGAHAPQGAMAWLQRPIDPVHIMRELDSLVEHRQSAPGELRAAIADDVAATHQLGGIVVDASASSFGAFDSGETGSGPDVLVAEDSAIARRFMQVKLQQLGYRVHLAHDGEEAMTLLRRERFVLAFLDIVLGPPSGLDGLRICQQLKHSAEFAGTAPKVIMVTGLSGAMDKVRGSLAGCDAYLTKPVVESELLHALRTLDAGFAARDPESPVSRRLEKRKPKGL